MLSELDRSFKAIGVELGDQVDEVVCARMGFDQIQNVLNFSRHRISHDPFKSSGFFVLRPAEHEWKQGACSKSLAMHIASCSMGRVDCLQPLLGRPQDPKQIPQRPTIETYHSIAYVHMQSH